MRVSEALQANSIATNAAWPDLDAAVAGLVARLVSSGRLPASLESRAVAAVCERERIASTILVDIGVSVPHARLDGVHGIVCALALAPSAIFGAPAGTPISIVALVLSAPASTGEHLNFLSSLSILLHSDSLRRALQSAATPEAALDRIRLAERR
jgi:mannitol/fructose-specific phosphotransferase system IIA component (Ntr-type)